MKQHYGIILLLLVTIAAGCSITTRGPVTATPAVVSATWIPDSSPSEAESAAGLPVVSPQRTPTITPVPSSTLTPAPSNTPVIGPTSTRTLTSTPVTITGQVCATCGNLRLREEPGTAGEVLTYLDANTPLTIIGRTADNAWVQIVTSDNESGWLAVQYVDIDGDLDTVPVSGTALNLPTAEAPPTVPPGPGGVPVVSGISSHARQIFLDGQAKGNRANVFSKIGDSITFSGSFMHHLAGNYNLGVYDYLQPAVYFFRGPNARGENSFSAASVAASPGWTTVIQLTPGSSTSPLCGADELPFVCEYRTAKPAVAIIMLGTVDSEGMITVEQYRANLEQIVQITIDMGIIPVLTMIPPMTVEAARNERVDQISQQIAAVARAYDIPLINYYAAMKQLPNMGLSGDGGHPSEPPDGRFAVFDEAHLQYGYVMRNLITLQMLYELWRQVLYDGDSSGQAPSTAVVPDTYYCPGTPAIALQVGRQGRVTPGLANKVRNSPSLSAGQIGKIDEGEVFSVIDGPQCADGFTWWKVSYDGLEGWTASGTGADPWIEPYP